LAPSDTLVALRAEVMGADALEDMHYPDENMVSRLASMHTHNNMIYAHGRWSRLNLGVTA